MQDAIRVLAGRCTARYEDLAAGEEHAQRGTVVTVVKPDNTVLVHDEGGYQPAAWLTRARSVRLDRDGDGGTTLDARGDGERLRLAFDPGVERAGYPASPAGPPVGACPDCEATLVRDGPSVVCVGCRARYAVPRDATVLREDCPDCGLPTLSVDRGVTVEVCVDRDCETIEDAVGERLDGEWDCPDCGTGLVVRRDRGLRAACPDCGVDFRLPAGTLAGTCDCGLPRFETRDGTRCLDPTCERGPADGGES